MILTTWYSRNKKRCINNQRKYRKRNKRKINLNARKYNGLYKAQRAQHAALLKEAIMNMYSHGDACCERCKIADIDVLCLDHVENNGCDDIDDKGRRLCGPKLYRKLQANDYPSGYQVLCANCNMKKEITRKRGRCAVTRN